MLSLLIGCSGPSPENTPRTSSNMSPSTETARAFFQQDERTVLTFVGYSGKGYEKPDAMLETARTILAAEDPKTLS